MKFLPSARRLLLRFASWLSAAAVATSLLMFLGLWMTGRDAERVATIHSSISTRLVLLQDLLLQLGGKEVNDSNMRGLFAIDFENLEHDLRSTKLDATPEWRAFRQLWLEIRSSDTPSRRKAELAGRATAVALMLQRESQRLGSGIGHQVFVAQTLGLLGLLATAAISLILAQDMITKIIRPVRNMAEDLALRIDFFKETLRFSEPETIEVDKLQRILTRFWKQYADYRRSNVERIEAESEKLRATVNAIDDGILVLNSEEIVVHVNKGFAALVELPMHEILGRPWNDLDSASHNYLQLRRHFDEVDEDSEDTVQLEIPAEEDASPPSPGAHGEAPVARKTMEVFSGKKKSFVDAGGQAGFIFMLHQYSEEGAKVALRQRVLLLVQGALRTPVQSLRVGIQLAMSSLASAENSLRITDSSIPAPASAPLHARLQIVQRQVAEAARFLDIVKRSREHIETIAHNLTSFDIDEFGSREELTNLPKFLGTCVDAERLTAQESAVQIAFETGSEDIVGTVDKDAMQVVIDNLLTNAVSASAQSAGTDRRVLLRLWQASEFWAKFPPAQNLPSFVIEDLAEGNQDTNKLFAGVVVVVADTGPGVEQELEENLFTPGLQGTRIKTGEKGGLGLAFAKEVAEANDGFVWLSGSEIVSGYPGAQFVVFWPMT